MVPDGYSRTLRRGGASGEPVAAGWGTVASGASVAAGWGTAVSGESVAAGCGNRVKQVLRYSVLRLLIGLAIAALIAWKLTVASAMMIARKAETRNTHQLMVIR